MGRWTGSPLTPRTSGMFPPQRGIRRAGRLGHGAGQISRSRHPRGSRSTGGPRSDGWSGRGRGPGRAGSRV